MGDRDFSRVERVGDQMQRHLAEIITLELSDPRVPTVTISGVEVSRDLRNAKVFVTPPAGSDPQEVLEAINRAAGFIRRRLGEKIRLKFLPRLKFEYDPTLDKADRLSALIRSANESSNTNPSSDGPNHGPDED